MVPDSVASRVDNACVGGQTESGKSLALQRRAALNKQHLDRLGDYVRTKSSAGAYFGLGAGGMRARGSRTLAKFERGLRASSGVEELQRSGLSEARRKFRTRDELPAGRRLLLGQPHIVAVPAEALER